MCIFFFFFFQAEDGIRDLVRSRGLGDVYKRQISTSDGNLLMAGITSSDTIDGMPTGWRGGFDGWLVKMDTSGTVSYTHLTLPTSDLV